VVGAEAPPDLALVRDPVRARVANTTTAIEVVTVAAILEVFVLEARALSIASAQSLGVLRIAILARTGTIALITDMIAVGTAMIILAPSPRVMAHL
jgi:hypothetical protein